MSQAPLHGLRVVEFAHMVMGPACGLMLADLGADVIKVEPAGEAGKPAGDNTRRLEGAGTGFFAIMNRNKRSLVLDLKSAEGMRIARRLLARADVLIENFRPGALDALGLSYESLRAENPRLIYCSCKGFLPGPYDHRVALDEVVQMMGGLAYMTGLPGKPMRAGSSINDILGGTFAALGVLAAVEERHRTGLGKHVQSGLFETNAVLVAQHMAQAVISGTPPPPMGVRQPAWPIYDIFDTSDGGQVFVGVVTDTQWRLFCTSFGLEALLADPALATQAQRVVRGTGPAVRADRPAGRPVRRPASEGVRRPGAADLARRPQHQSAGPAAVDGRRAAGPALRPAEGRPAHRGDTGRNRLGGLSYFFGGGGRSSSRIVMCSAYDTSPSSSSRCSVARNSPSSVTSTVAPLRFGTGIAIRGLAKMRRR
jgi:crotonobetainyl-CoA:carnitine CoA-transferase CaiB-like acyl-CoA transferase